jgi:hypothetical protein
MRHKVILALIILVSLSLLIEKAEPVLGNEPDDKVPKYLVNQGFFRRSDILFQNLTVTPSEVNHEENITIQFRITNNHALEHNIGFIIEHHPPAYRIIHNKNMSLKFFQYAKSVSVRPNQTVIYKYVLGSPNYHPGVNSITINYLGGQIIGEAFTVNQPVEDYVDAPYPDKIDYDGLFPLFSYGLIIGIAGIVILTFYNKLK